jgi:hypothetical protein
LKSDFIPIFMLNFFLHLFFNQSIFFATIVAQTGTSAAGTGTLATGTGTGGI